MKKLLVLLLVFALILSVCPVAMAATVTDSGDWGENLLWSLDDGGTLIISGEGDMQRPPIYSIEFPWKKYANDIRHIVIREGVTSIAVNAFDRFVNLITVDLPAGLSTIGVGAFNYCESLTSVNIPASVTSIDASAFDSCHSLTAFTVENGNQLYTSVDGVLFDKDIKTIVQYPLAKKDTSYTIPSSVTTIGDEAFSENEHLTTVYIPNGVTSIGDMAFSNCVSLTTVDFPDTVTSIGEGTFANCRGLTEMVIPEGVRSIGERAFTGCLQLTHINIPTGITIIEKQTFNNCPITSVTIPEGVTSIGEQAFYGGKFTDITIPASVTEIWSGAFGGTVLSSITFAGNAPSFRKVDGNGLGAFDKVIATCHYPADNETWNQYVNSGVGFGGTLTWVPYSGSEFPVASGTCGDNVDFTLRADGTLIISGSGAMESYVNWSEHKDSIRAVVIEDGVTSICSYAFKDCTALEAVEIPSSLTEISIGCFYECTGLRTIEIPDSVIKIRENAFYGCTSLLEVNIPNAVEMIYPLTFANCYNLASITIPDSVKSIEDYAFQSCNRSFEITFVGNAPEIKETAFNGLNATCYYPADNVTWTESIRKEQMGSSGKLTWVPYSAQPHSFSFNPDETAIYKGETATVSLIIDKDITVLAGTVTISAEDGSGNKLEITEITPGRIANCQLDIERSKILIVAEGSISAGTEIATISFATDEETVAGDYVVTLVPDLYTGDMESDANDQKLDFAVNEGKITVSELPVTVTWVNEDGTVLEIDKNVKYGSTPEYNGETPTKESDVEYNYTFNRWNPEVDAVTENTTYTAIYTANLRSYTLTFKDESGDIIEELTVPYGTEPQNIIGIPEFPVKADTPEYTYSSNGWNVKKVTGDATYTASYTANKNSYTITWKNEDGRTLGTTTVEYGEVPTYATPNKSADIGYTYSFSNWTPSVVPVVGATEYQAVYTGTARTYAVSIEGLVDDATFILKDSVGTEIEPSNGKYNLTYDQMYSYSIDGVDYKPVNNKEFTVRSGNGWTFDSNTETAVLTLSTMEKFIGDMNGDNAITVVDAQALYNYILDRYQLDNDGKVYNNADQLVFNLNVADINGNNNVGADDILPMLRLINQN